MNYYLRLLKAIQFRINLYISFIMIRRKFSHIAVLIRHRYHFLEKKYENSRHLDICMEWLCYAQNASKSGGVSGGYSLEKGWLPPYPETTGYIIPTFIKYSEISKDKQYIDRAIQMADWEIGIQLANGAVRGGMGIKEYPIVFNTGQVILGWISLFEKLRDEKYLKAVKNAADWLISVQDNDGCWIKSTYLNTAHSYNSRVAWSLMTVYKNTGMMKYKEAAMKNIQWVLSRVEKNNWIKDMSFFPDNQPLTHTLAYTLRGMHESSFYLDNQIKEQIQNIVFNALVNIKQSIESYQNRRNNLFFMPAKYNNQWQGAENTYSCLTGNAQLGILYYKYYQILNDQHFYQIYNEILNSLKTVQCLSSNNTGIRGGIPGSYPIWGEYMRYIYPNWAAKYFADLILINK